MQETKRMKPQRLSKNY